MKRDSNSIKEKDFYTLCDAIDSMEDENITDLYFPLVEEFESHKVKSNLKKYLPLILYFSKDPFKKQEMDESELNEYRKTVAYTQKLVSELKLS